RKGVTPSETIKTDIQVRSSVTPLYTVLTGRRAGVCQEALGCVRVSAGDRVCRVAAHDGDGQGAAASVARAGDCQTRQAINSHCCKFRAVEQRFTQKNASRSARNPTAIAAARTRATAASA